MPTHKWHFDITEEARRQLRNLSSKDRLLVFGRIRELLLADNPKALLGVKKIVDGADEWRARQGDYRIFFSHPSEKVIHEKHEYDGTILVLRVLHGKDAYKK